MENDIGCQNEKTALKKWILSFLKNFRNTFALLQLFFIKNRKFLRKCQVVLKKFQVQVQV